MRVPILGLSVGAAPGGANGGAPEQGGGASSNTPSPPANSGLVRSAASLGFGLQDVGSRETQSVLLTNAGSTPLALQGLPSVQGAVFSASTNCAQSLAAGASCALSVEFAPAAPLPATGEVRWAYSTEHPELTVSLSGTGRAVVNVTSVSPSTLVNVGGTTVTVTGAGFSDGSKPLVKVGTTTVAESDVTVLSDTQLTFRMPVLASGTYSVTVTSSKGSSRTLDDALQVAAAIGGTLTTLRDSQGRGTLPSSFGNCSSRMGAVGYGQKSFLVPCITSNWGGNLYAAVWTGSGFSYRTIYRYSSMANSGVAGVFQDPRGFVVMGAGNYNMTSSFRIRTVSTASENQTGALSEFVHTSMGGTSGSVVAVVPDPTVTGGYFGVLRTTAAGDKTLLKFVVNAAGVISNVSAIGSRGASDPLAPVMGTAVIGRDGRVYVGSSMFSNSAQPILAIDPQTGAITTAFPGVYDGYNLTLGLAKDLAGNLYVGTNAGAIYRSSWNGSGYDPLQVTAGALGVSAVVDGPLGVNRLSASSMLIQTDWGNELGLVMGGTGGAYGFYRILN